MGEPELVRIGTRGSPLALVQARMVAAALESTLERRCEIVVIKTTGDHILDRPLAEIGGKGLFTKEIEEQLLDRRIDIAVHSMKDMPTELPEGLVIGAMLPRADPRDALVCKGATSIADLRQDALVGTASLRRAAQIKLLRRDIRTETLRGSVQTRLRRIEEGAFDATLLAQAGLDRLGLEDTAVPLSMEEILPAVAQGAIGIECVEDDPAIRGMLAAIDHLATSSCVEIERVFLGRLDGSCRTPIAAHATLEERRGGKYVHFRGLVARPDGSEVHRRQDSAPLSDGTAMAAGFGEELRALIGPDFFAPDSFTD